MDVIDILPHNIGERVLGVLLLTKYHQGAADIPIIFISLVPKRSYSSLGVFCEKVFPKGVFAQTLLGMRHRKGGMRRR